MKELKTIRQQYNTNQPRNKDGRYGFKDGDKKMRSITFHMPREWILHLDLLVREGKSPNRAELIRYAVRDLLVSEGMFRPYETPIRDKVLSYPPKEV